MKRCRVMGVSYRVESGGMRSLSTSLTPQLILGSGMKRVLLKKVDEIGEPCRKHPTQISMAERWSWEIGHQERGNGGQDKMGAWRAVHSRNYCLW